MPSPADRARLERILRAAALLALAWLIAGSFARRAHPGGATVPPDQLSSVLPHWTLDPPADTLGVRFDAPPDRVTRDWLGALGDAGTVVGWTGPNLSPLIVEAEPVQDPAGGVTIRLGGGRGPVLLADSLGPLDSLSLDGLGTALRVPSHAGGIRATAGATTALVQAADATQSRSLLVLGMAGWESRFLVQALDERGWRVEARLGVAPRLAVTRGTPFPIDTSRIAAVIALDSSAASYSAQLADYVRSGGGLILGPGVSPRSLGSARGEIARIRQDDERRALAAWRLGNGRVLQVSDDETWRWRMQPGDAAVADHRRWWASLVSTVAFRSPEPGPSGDPAPLAAMVTTLGPPSPELPGEGSLRSWWPLALAVLLLGLFGEWTSRRLRGAA